MKIVSNGESTEIAGPMPVTELLAVQQVEMPDMVSVELNGKILSRKEFDTTVIHEGDKVEFLYFMGGGSAGRASYAAE